MFGFGKRSLDWPEVQFLFCVQLIEAYKELGQVPDHAYLMSRLDKFVSDAKLKLSHEQRALVDFAALNVSMTPSEFDGHIRKVVEGRTEEIQEILELLQRRGCRFGPAPTLDELLQLVNASARNTATTSPQKSKENVGAGRGTIRCKKCLSLIWDQRGADGSITCGCGFSWVPNPG